MWTLSALSSVGSYRRQHLNEGGYSPLNPRWLQPHAPTHLPMLQDMRLPIPIKGARSYS